MKYLLAVCIALTASAAHAAPVRIECPERIQTRQQADIPRNWRGFIDTVNTHHRILRVDLYDGAPEELAQLKPDNGDADNTGPAYWSVGSSTNLFVTCAYTDTAIRLTRKIDGAPQRCAVLEHEKEPRGISCE